MSKIQITLSAEQAAAVSQALETYTRLCLGQLEHVAELVRQGEIPLAQVQDPGAPREIANIACCEAVDDCLLAAKSLLGFPAAGSHSVGHPHTSLSARRAHEVQKALFAAHTQDIGVRYTKNNH